jgi:hypothetical protein
MALHSALIVNFRTSLFVSLGLASCYYLAMFLPRILRTLYFIVPTSIVASFVVPVWKAIIFSIAIVILDVLIATILRRVIGKSQPNDSRSSRRRRATMFGGLAGALTALAVVAYDGRLIFAFLAGVLFSILMAYISPRSRRQPTTREL